jgi:hypothetical protein
MNKNVLIFLAVIKIYHIWVPYPMKIGKGNQVIINQEKLIEIYDISEVKFNEKFINHLQANI